MEDRFRRVQRLARAGGGLAAVACGVGALVQPRRFFQAYLNSAIKVFNWTMTLYRGSISFETPMLYGLGFGCDRVVDAVSTFSDVEYSWDVHCGKFTYGCE